MKRTIAELWGLMPVQLTLLLMLATTLPAAALQPGEPIMDRLYNNRIDVESASYLSIHLFDLPIDHAKAKDPKQFTITSDDDANYAAAKSVNPAASGSRTRAIRVSNRKDLLVHGTMIFLKLPTPMQNGKTYAVKIADIGATQALPELAPVKFDDARQVSDNIRVNQLGYLPKLAKHAYLGRYMGDLGPMPFDEAKTFEVVDRDGKSVFSGTVARRNVNEKLVGQNVYEMDFTKLDAPGEYRLRVPGVGLSYPFRIGAQAWNPLYVNLMRGHYHQRCGFGVDATYSRHAREACHLDDAYIEEESQKTNFTDPKNPPYYPTRFGRHQKATGGHHDAGDYGKYTITGATYVFSALQAMAVFPDKFRQDNLGLPYSGNGVPDVLEEVKWELDWLENMQDEDDGGVFGVIRPRSGGYEHSMPPKESKRLFFPKDTVFTAAYAGALAHASASPDIRKHYPQDAERYLAKAKKAWEFLEKNNRFIRYFHYGAEFDDWDERCWAAIELYAATGEDQYHQYALKNFDPAKKRWEWWPLFEAVGYATHRYTFLEGRDKDAKMLERCKSLVRETCDMHVRFAKEDPYRLSMPEPTIRHGNYGWIFPGDLAGYDLLMGYALDKKPEYLQVAADNLSYICGTNPHGYFLQTGLGAKRNIEVVSDVSNSDNIIEPIPGIPLGIGTAGFYGLAQYGKRIAEPTYPNDWPLMNRWYDGFNVGSEFTMGPMMRETIAAGYFADVPPSSNDAAKLAVKITADKTSGPAPLTVQFGIAVKPADREVVQVFWDFGDEHFSSQAAPSHVFKEAGRQYPVAVTVIDSSGRSAYDRVTVSGSIANAAFAQTELKADPETIVLYHFNGDLTDAGANGISMEAVPPKKPVEKRPFSFASEPPAWMSEPSGSCLVLDGAEQLAATIPPNVLADPATTPMTLEALLYVSEWAGWAYDGDPLIFGLRSDWDSMFGIKQGTWEKANAPQFGNAVGVDKFAKEFPKNHWVQVKIVYDGKGSQELFVDGKSWGKSTEPTLKPQPGKPLVLFLGPIRGMIDEVRLSKGAK